MSAAKKRDNKSQILLGYEAGTGEPVYIPLKHLVVTGLTQDSGKTTTLEGLISRSELTSIAFQTKRGEGSFRLPNVHQHEPFFREKADWEYVAGLLEATMREKMRFERSWIIEASKNQTTLRGVLERVVEQLETARGISKSVLTTLRAYLEKVVPEIESIAFARELDLKPGLNVMNLIKLRDEVQSLVIASTLEQLHKTANDVIVVIPEAWKFVPEGRATPVKYPLEAIARQGAGVGVYLFLDSQDITGVDKAILKNVDTWLLGRQREKNEVERAIAQLPLTKTERPKPAEIMRLAIGHFLVATRDEVRTVYAKPAWLSVELAVKIAKTGNVDAARLFRPEPAPVKQEEDIDVSLRDELAEAKRELRELREKLSKATGEPGALAREYRAKNDGKAAPEDAADGEKVRYHLDVEVGVPTLTVRERVITLTATSEDHIGRAAILIADGFFDNSQNVNSIMSEFVRRGWGAWSGGAARSRMTRLLQQLAEYGFLLREAKTFVIRDDAKERIERVKESERR